MALKACDAHSKKAGGGSDAADDGRSKQYQRTCGGSARDGARASRRFMRRSILGAARETGRRRVCRGCVVTGRRVCEGPQCGGGCGVITGIIQRAMDEEQQGLLLEWCGRAHRRSLQQNVLVAPPMMPPDDPLTTQIQAAVAALAAAAAAEATAAAGTEGDDDDCDDDEENNEEEHEDGTGKSGRGAATTVGGMAGGRAEG